MAGTFLTSIEIVPSVDQRDADGGEVTPMGIVFRLMGPETTVTWSVNSGWVSRPVLSARLREGQQDRSDRPGADPHLAALFPEPMRVLVAHADVTSPDRDRWLSGYQRQLLTAMIEGGDEAVFALLREIYDDNCGVPLADD